MAEESPKTKRRRLRAAPVTMRERAERASAQSGNKQHKIRTFVRSFSGRISSLKLWKPLRFASRFVAHFLIPPYLRNSWAEVRQVTWPNRKQTRQLTTAVILFSVVFGLIVAVFDYGLDKLFKQVILK